MLKRGFLHSIDLCQLRSQMWDCYACRAEGLNLMDGWIRRIGNYISVIITTIRPLLNELGLIALHSGHVAGTPKLALGSANSFLSQAQVCHQPGSGLQAKALVCSPLGWEIHDSEKLLAEGGGARGFAVLLWAVGFSPNRAQAVGKAQLRQPGGFVLLVLISKTMEYCSAQLAGVVWA